MTNNYRSVMKSKSDRELIAILNAKDQYKSEAVKEAENEIENRGGNKKAAERIVNKIIGKDKQDSLDENQVVWEKIENAGWAFRIVAIVIIVIDIVLFISFLPLLFKGTIEKDIYFYASFFIATAICILGFSLYHLGRTLKRNKISIEKARTWLIVTTILFIPLSGGLIGLMIVWYNLKALSAIRYYLKNIQIVQVTV